MADADDILDDLDETADPDAKLLEDLCAGSESEAVRTLAVEAVRVWNRLTRLDEVLIGDEETWLVVARGESGDITLRIDGILAEARQQANTYRGLIAEIRRLIPVDDNGAAQADDLAGMPE